MAVPSKEQVFRQTDLARLDLAMCALFIEFTRELGIHQAYTSKLEVHASCICIMYDKRLTLFEAKKPSS